MQSDSALHEMPKFSLAYRAKSVTLHEKRKGTFSLQPVAYVVMDVMCLSRQAADVIPYRIWLLNPGPRIRRPEGVLFEPKHQHLY